MVELKQKSHTGFRAQLGRIPRAWGGALLITLSVLVLNIVARVFLREKSSP